jgi:hypothetical protein
MGGDLDVASLPGTGSSFVLVLPGPAGSNAPDALSRAVADAVSFEIDRLEAVAAERTSPAVRRAAAQLRTRPTLSTGIRR